jgi:uncharacterized protein DUF3455
VPWTPRERPMAPLEHACAGKQSARVTSRTRGSCPSSFAIACAGGQETTAWGPKQSRPLGANVIAWRRAIAPGGIRQGSAFMLLPGSFKPPTRVRGRLEARPRPGQGDECQVSPQLTAEHETITKRVAGSRFPRRSRVKIDCRLSRSIVAVAGGVAVSAAVATTASARPTPQTAPATCSIRGRTRPTAGSTSSCTRAASRSTRVRRTAPGSSPIRRRRSTRRRALRSRSAPIFSTSRPGAPCGSSRGAAPSRPRGRRARREAPGGPGNIAWLPQAVATSPGRLGQTTWIQSLNTTGGVAPAATCTPGATTAVPYSADYFLWRDRG